MGNRLKAMTACCRGRRKYILRGKIFVFLERPKESKSTMELGIVSGFSDFVYQLRECRGFWSHLDFDYAGSACTERLNRWLYRVIGLRNR